MPNYSTIFIYECNATVLKSSGVAMKYNAIISNVTFRYTGVTLGKYQNHMTDEYERAKEVTKVAHTTPLHML